MIRGANIVLDVHLVLVLLQHVRVRLQSLLQLLRGLVAQFALAGVVVRGPLQLPGRLPLVLRFPQLLLMLHPPVLEPGFNLRGKNAKKKKKNI